MQHLMVLVVASGYLNGEVIYTCDLLAVRDGDYNGTGDSGLRKPRRLLVVICLDHKRD